MDFVVSSYIGHVTQTFDENVPLYMYQRTDAIEMFKLLV